MTDIKQARTPGLWRPRVSERLYTMQGRPSKNGWASFQCLDELQRIREWNLRDMVPMDDVARAALAAAGEKV